MLYNKVKRQWVSNEDEEDVVSVENKVQELKQKMEASNERLEDV